MIQPEATGHGRRACDRILYVGCNVDGSSCGWNKDVSIKETFYKQLKYTHKTKFYHSSKN